MLFNTNFSVRWNSACSCKSISLIFYLERWSNETRAAMKLDNRQSGKWYRISVACFISFYLFIVQSINIMEIMFFSICYSNMVKGFFCSTEKIIIYEITLGIFSAFEWLLVFGLIGYRVIEIFLLDVLLKRVFIIFRSSTVGWKCTGELFFNECGHYVIMVVLDFLFWYWCAEHHFLSFR